MRRASECSGSTDRSWGGGGGKKGRQSLHLIRSVDLAPKKGKLKERDQTNYPRRQRLRCDFRQVEARKKKRTTSKEREKKKHLKQMSKDGRWGRLVGLGPYPPCRRILIRHGGVKSKRKCTEEGLHPQKNERLLID